MSPDYCEANLKHEQPSYEASPEDLQRADRVHALICARPEEFRVAAKWLDDQYSADRLHERAQEQAQMIELAQELARVSGSVNAEGQGEGGTRGVGPIDRLITSTWIPTQLLGNGRKWWLPCLRRWEIVLINLIDGTLPLTPAALNWPVLARVLFIYWITCDERAEREHHQSTFQDWMWNGPDVFRRATVRCFVASEGWPKLNRSVDLGLAFAERHASRTAPPPQSPAESPAGAQRGPAELTVHHPNKMLVRISGSVAGQGFRTVEIRGPSLARLFRLVEEKSRGLDPGSMVAWEEVRSAWHQGTGFRGHLIGQRTLEDYGRRIRRALRESGFGHLWEQDSGTGVRWRG